MTAAYAAKLSLRPRPTNVSAQKIDGSVLETYSITSASFLLQDGQRSVRFFEKTFLLHDTSMNIVLRITFLGFDNADIRFVEIRKLTWSFYTFVKALPTINWVKFIEKTEFTKVALDKNSETFVIYVIALTAETLIHLLQVAQIAGL